MKKDALTEYIINQNALKKRNRKCIIKLSTIKLKIEWFQKLETFVKKSRYKRIEKKKKCRKRKVEKEKGNNDCKTN